MEPVKRVGMMCAAFVLTAGLTAWPASAQGMGGAGQTPPAGQPGGQSGHGGTDVAGQPNGPSPAARANMRQNDLQKFVQKAAISNLAEIQFSKLASDRSQDPQVKDFAKMMEDQHQKALDDLKQVASSNNIEVPDHLDSKHQKIEDKLSALNGSRFDREYMKIMVKDHKEAENLLRRRASEGNAAVGTSGSNPPGATGTSGSSATAANAAEQVDSWAAKTLPAVREHLDKAEQIEKSLKGNSKNEAKENKGYK